MADDLVAFLRARLDEDEAHARKDIWAADSATQGEWRAHYGTNLPHSWVRTEDGDVLRLDADWHNADALLVARFQPRTVHRRAERVLREVEAKRRLLAEHFAPDEEGRGRYPWAHCPTCSEYDRPDPLLPACPTLRLLALPYAARPGYKEKWKP